jgi:hypothetical protein
MDRDTYNTVEGCLTACAIGAVLWLFAIIAFLRYCL